MSDKKKEGDARGEEIKNQSDTYLQDYLENFRQGLEGYSTSIVRYMDTMQKSMDRQRDDIVGHINQQIEMINRRLGDMKGVSNHVSEQSPSTNVKRGGEEEIEIRPEQVADLKTVFEHIRNLLDQIEKNLTKGA